MYYYSICKPINRSSCNTYQFINNQFLSVNKFLPKHLYFKIGLNFTCLKTTTTKINVDKFQLPNLKKQKFTQKNNPYFPRNCSDSSVNRRRQENHQKCQYELQVQNQSPTRLPVKIQFFKKKLQKSIFTEQSKD